LKSTAEKATRDILHWIGTSVVVPRAELGGFAPCPFAKSVLAGDGLSILTCQSADYQKAVLDAVNEWHFKQQIVVFCLLTRPSLIEAQDAQAQLNETLNPLDLIVLLDHPDDDFSINGFRTGNGQHVLLLVQKLSQLNEASDKLRQNCDYYANWSTENIERVLRLPGRVNRQMTFTHEDIRAIIPAIWTECTSLTRIEKAEELLPAGKAKLDKLRTILRSMLAETGWELSESESKYAGL
jgi:hypothetical protein